MPMCIHIAPEAEQDPLPWRRSIRIPPFLDEKFFFFWGPQNVF
jgi:hypothetical protein